MRSRPPPSSGVDVDVALVVDVVVAPVEVLLAVDDPAVVVAAVAVADADVVDEDFVGYGPVT
ncbi:hypothetical protein COL154_009903 [Colletotrichum chrysophilum]|nr:hypothetical protein KNSL1_009026 [Colletotrichum chrysophilum]KAJ0357694.1 hypothetical protein COL154_009903 [Colletotrichum chrysophilum]